MMRASKKPAVGHNATLDLAFTLAAFAQPLPLSWQEYKLLAAEWCARGYRRLLDLCCPWTVTVTSKSSSSILFLGLSMCGAQSAMVRLHEPGEASTRCPLTQLQHTCACRQLISYLPRRFADLYDTKLLARHLPAVFEGDTSLGQVYDGIVGGSRREQARMPVHCPPPLGRGGI